MQQGTKKEHLFDRIDRTGVLGSLLLRELEFLKKLFELFLSLESFFPQAVLAVMGDVLR
jgi:hypothetical protein